MHEVDSLQTFVYVVATQYLLIYYDDHSRSHGEGQMFDVLLVPLRSLICILRVACSDLIIIQCISAICKSDDPRLLSDATPNY